MPKCMFSLSIVIWEEPPSRLLALPWVGCALPARDSETRQSQGPCYLWPLFLLLPILLVESTIVAAHVIAWLYRFSIKSTSVVWLPLLYISSDIVPQQQGIDERLYHLCESAGARLARAYSLVIGTFLSLKLIGQVVLYKNFYQFISSWEILRRFTPLIGPLGLPLWQILKCLQFHSNLVHLPLW